MKKLRLFYCRFCGHDGALKGAGKLSTCAKCGRKGIVNVGMTERYFKANYPEIRSTGLQIHCMVNSFFKKVGC
jgi:hypothetical protein